MNLDAHLEIWFVMRGRALLISSAGEMGNPAVLPITAVMQEMDAIPMASALQLVDKRIRFAVQGQRHVTREGLA